MTIRIRTLALTIAGAALLAAAALSPASAVEPPLLRVSTQSKETIETWKLSGVLNDAPYKVEWSLLATATEETASLLANTTDVAVSEGTVSVTLQQGNSKSAWDGGKAPVTIIAAHSPRDFKNYQSMVTVVLADGPIKSPADLKGRSITFKEGGNMQTTSLLAVKAAGLKPSEVKLVNLNPADGLVAFRSGQVDALTNSPSQLQDLLTSGKARVLYTNTDVGFPASTATVVRTADLADPAKVEIFRDFVKRIQRWNDWKANNKAAYEKILTDIAHLRPEAAKYQAGASVSDVVVVDDAFLAIEQRIADVLAEAGGIPRKVDVRVQYDPRFNADIIAERKVN